ncbi:MAG: polysaccharide deacetylase family protein [Planctomycetes bacterium]|nr:polysaccharide deacetylase family protein [Planctomycetota bacterium]MCB9870232.1 polysaccharide deacetylase family protein [Planctomycetota bacterium]
MIARPDTLSVDVEDWYHLNYDAMAGVERRDFEPRVERNTERLLALFAEHGARATFFFLGSVAEEYPELVRAAAAAGHEIASHGYAHELVYSQSRDAFRADVARSLAILQDLTSAPIRGYRAPSWSIRPDRETPWFYEVLAELGLAYSASLFPFTTYLYGDSSAPLGWFRPGDGTMVEVPTTVAEVAGRRMPFSGGFYLRALPYTALRWAGRRVHAAGRPVMYYLHPREIDPDQPRLKLPRRDALVTYIGLRGAERKLRRLLRAMPTAPVPIADYLAAEGALPAHVADAAPASTGR